MINQQRVISSGETNGQFHHTPVSAKPSVVSVSSIDSDVSDRRDVREALYSGIFRRHRKTILVLGSFLKMLRKNLNKVQALSRILAMIVMRFDHNAMSQPFY
ncbi:uncharacterized protein [Fopius arisanus]|uniref:Uncharacterized protein n=1 Tax=Fopius arisanus TaxID=64838 RepID=A0A9R1TZE9_9HYME|nr:PREDICTED: uncharacterized protein LOC105265682 [Fopius arisanus]XP_011301603.1 PREDICTED: uncharacterized protein LOC105265682 [Fopius arisanus]